MDYSGHNKYYTFFRNQAGHQLLQGKGVAIPDLGEIYRFKGGLRTGRGQFMLGRARIRSGSGIASYLLSMLQRATPFLRTLGSKAIDVASNIAKDAIRGDSLKTAAISNIRANVPDSIVSHFLPPETTPEKFTIIPNVPKKTSLKRKVTFAPNSLKRRGVPKRSLTGRGLREQYPGLRYIDQGEDSNQ